MYKYNSIVIDSDGALLAYTNGSLSAPAELRKRIKRASDLNKKVELIYGVKPVIASLDDPTNYIAVIAALFAANPGRSRILEAPKVVEEWFEKNSAYKEGVIY